MAMMTNTFAFVPIVQFSSALSKIFKLLETTHSEKGACMLINIYSTTFDIITAHALNYNSYTVPRVKYSTISKMRLNMISGLYECPIAQNPDKTNGDMIIYYISCVYKSTPADIAREGVRQYTEKVYFRSNKAMGMQVEDHATMII